MAEVIFAAIYGLNGGFCLLVFVLTILTLAFVASSGGIAVQPVDTPEDNT